MTLDAARMPWRAMALNNVWANATLYRTLTAMPSDAFTASRPGFFGSLAATMTHILEVDLYYLDALEAGGRGRDLRDMTPIEDARELAHLQADADARFARFCTDLTEARLSETRDTDREGGPVPEQVAALILHLVQHQVHHRGQAHTQLSHAGVAPPQLDDFYLRHARVPEAAAYWA